MPNLKSQHLDLASLTALDTAILSPDFPDAELRAFLEAARHAAETFAQTARYLAIPRPQGKNGWDQLWPLPVQDRAPDMSDPQTRRHHADLILAQERFAQRLQHRLKSGAVTVAARDTLPDAPLELIDRKTWVTATPSLAIAFGAARVTKFRIDAQGPGIRLFDLHLAPARQNKRDDLPPHAQAALKELIATYDPTRPHTYASTIEFARAAPFKCPERLARAVWKALPAEKKFQNGKGVRRPLSAA